MLLDPTRRAARYPHLAQKTMVGTAMPVGTMVDAENNNLYKATLPVTKASLRLYIAGHSASSRRAEQNLQHLRTFMNVERWTVEIIDVLAKPELAEEASILATPTLCYEYSGRPRRIVGDLSDTKRVLEFLGIQQKGGDA